MTRRTRKPAKIQPVPATRRRAPWVRSLLLPALLIAACAVAAHAPSAPATFVWDDDVNLTANPHLRDLAGLGRLWFEVGATNMYAPVVFSTLWLQYRLWGLDPTGYHIVNIALHAVCAVLVWLLFRRLLPSGALLGAALFAVHPVTVESVAWITELRNVESLLFYLLCVLAYLRFAGLDGRQQPAGRTRRAAYVAVLLLFAAALLSKPAGVALPFIVLLLAWWKRGRIERGDALVALPMLAMSLAAGLLTAYVDRHFAGGAGPAWQMSVVERGLVAGRVVWFYAGKLVWPHPLISIYPRWAVDAMVWWQYLYPLALIAVLAGLWAARTRIGRGPAVAGCAFVLLVAPTSGLFNFSYHLYSFVADRYQYHASIALIALGAAGVTALARRAGLAPGPIPTIASAALVVGLGAMSAVHAESFRSEKARCLATLERNPAAWVAMNNLGVALNAEGRHEEAVQWFRKALTSWPVYPEAHSNLGVALVALGRSREAVTHYEEALRVWPNYARAHNNLATALAGLGDTGGAIRHYEIALTLQPDFAEAHNNLAQVLSRMGDLAGAMDHHRAALRIRPDYVEAHHDLGVTLTAARRYDEAVVQYREALRLDPAHVGSRAGLSAALAASGRSAEAETEWSEAVRLAPRDARARTDLGLALAARGRLDEAAAQFEEALRLDPGDADAHNGLGNAFASRGSLPDAIAHYREAVRLKPEAAEARGNLGKALASSGNIAEAIVELQEAVRRDDSLADAHNTLGVCLAQTGRLDEAIVHFQRAVGLAPANPSARENLDRARALKGGLPPAGF